MDIQKRNLLITKLQKAHGIDAQAVIDVLKSPDLSI